MQLIPKFGRSCSYLPLLARLTIVVVFFLGFLLTLQTPLVFPGAVLSLFNKGAREQATLPDGVLSRYVTTSDGERLELWRLRSSNISPVAVIFNGNGGDVEKFFSYQEYFLSLGITTYCLKCISSCRRLFSSALKR